MVPGINKPTNTPYDKRADSYFGGNGASDTDSVPGRHPRGAVSNFLLQGGSGHINIITSTEEIIIAQISTVGLQRHGANNGRRLIG